MKKVCIFIKLKNLMCTILLLSVLYVCTSCVLLPTGDDRLTVVASIFPQYDIVRAIAGEKINCEMLITPGADSHRYDPSVSDIIKVKKSDLFIYTGVVLEPWTNSLVNALPHETKVLDLFEELEKEDSFEELILEHLEEEEEHDHAGHNHEVDPHIWTNPQYVILMAKIIEKTLSEIDPSNADFYHENTLKYISLFEEIDRAIINIRKMYVSSSVKSINFVAPFAFAYLFRDYFTPYSISFHTVYDTCSIEVDPSIYDIIEMNKRIKTENVKVVFLKELMLNTKIANKIIEDTNAEIAILHSGNNVSREDFTNGITLYEIWLANVKALEREVV